MVGDDLREMVLAIKQQLDRIEHAQSIGAVKDAYTTQEAAGRLGKSDWTVRQWCNKGQVEGAYKIRGRGRSGEWRLTHESILRLQSRGPSTPGTHLAIER